MVKNSFLLLCIFVINFTCQKKITPQQQNEILNKNIPELPIFQKKFQDSDTITTNLPVLFFFKKTPCFGYCPVYEFTVYANGISCYNGLHFTPIEGKYYNLLDEKQWNELVNKYSSLEINNLKDFYPDHENQELPDLPKTIFTINLQGRTKTITDSHSAPKNLKEFELFVEKMINKFIETKPK